MTKHLAYYLPKDIDTEAVRQRVIQAFNSDKIVSLGANCGTFTVNQAYNQWVNAVNEYNKINGNGHKTLKSTRKRKPRKYTQSYNHDSMRNGCRH